MEHISTYIDTNSITHALVYLACAMVLFFIGKITYRLFNKTIHIADELVVKDNLAFSLSYTGYLLAVIIVIGASIVGDSNGLVADVLGMGVYSTLGIILLNCSIWLNNKLILPSFNIKKEIFEDHNAGTGLIEASVAVAVALILFGALIGESDSLIQGIFTFKVYWLIGMSILILSSKLFSFWMGYNIHQEIERDNVAAGLSFSGALIALGIIIMNALIHPFEDWTTTLLDVGIETGIALILLPIVRIITDKVLLPGQRLTDEIINQEKPNVGAALIEAFAYIAAALLITWSF